MNVIIQLITQSVIASLIRLWLVTSEYKKSITDRVEISTPLNSWKRVTEAVYLLNENANPYVGDLFHEPPLTLHIYKYFIQHSHEYLHCIFILCDILTASFLYLTTRRYHIFQQQCLEKKENKEFMNEIGLDKSDTKFENTSATYVFTAYLFNPYIIFNCVAMTTTVFSNLFLAVYLCLLIHKLYLPCCITLAVSASQTLYSSSLILPLLLNLDHKGKISKFTVLIYLWVFSSFLAICHLVSNSLNENCNYVDNTYGFILQVHDLRPNIGIFWYFMIEIFEHFRLLFITVFQINVLFLYLIPLSIKFRKDPVLLAASLIILTAIFKSYPSLGDFGFCLSLILMWTYLFSYIKYGFKVICCFLVTTILGPLVWHLWIYSRTANANFYFGVILFFDIAQVVLITDFLFAYLKADFWLKHKHMRNTELQVVRLSLE